jgi:c-di-AMP phosphodiesterase-like protein
MEDKLKFMRRREAASYLREQYGFGAERSLAKGAVTGDTPEYRKAGRIVLYTRDTLDRWALAKIGAPQRSSSDRPREP